MKKRTDISKEILIDLHYNQNKTLTQIGKIFDLKCPSIVGYFKMFNIKTKRDVRYPDLTGKKFGKLKVLKKSDIGYNNHKGRYWECECECGSGKITHPSSYRLQSGKTTSCGCIASLKTYRGYQNLSGTYWGIIKHSAKVRNLSLKITIEEAWNQYIKQDKKCAISGIDIILCREYSNGVEQNASLDRIDSSKGYIIDNIQWVHKHINIMKMDMEDKELYEWCKKIYLNNKDKYESYSGNE